MVAPRSPLFLLACLALALALLAPLAAAQTGSTTSTSGSRTPEGSGCGEEGGAWYLEVTEHGFRERGANGTFIDLLMQSNFTVGDCVEVHVFNFDENGTTHTVTLSGHDLNVRVSATMDDAEPTILRFTKEGTFTLKDEPSGDQRPVRVSEEDAGSTSSGSRGSPGPALPVVALALVALALSMRRR